MEQGIADVDHQSVEVLPEVVRREGTAGEDLAVWPAGGDLHEHAAGDHDVPVLRVVALPVPKDPNAGILEALGDRGRLHAGTPSISSRATSMKPAAWYATRPLP